MFTNLLTSICNIQAKSFTRVGYETLPTWGNIATNVPCRKDRNNSPSYTDEKLRTNTDDDLFFFDPTISIQKGYQIVFDGDNYDVIKVNKSYGASGVHHLEVIARLVDHK